MSVATIPPGIAQPAAAAPAITVTPMTLSFAQALGRTSRNQVISVSNTGGAPLTLGKIEIIGPQAGQFVREISSTCVSGVSVAVGTSCEMAVNFTPRAVGEHVASLVIPNNAAGSPTVLALNGVGLAAAQSPLASAASWETLEAP